MFEKFELWLVQVTENSQPVRVKTPPWFKIVSPRSGVGRSTFVRVCVPVWPMEGLEEEMGNVPQDVPVSSSWGAAPFHPEPSLLSGFSHPSQCFFYSFLHGLLGKHLGLSYFLQPVCSVSSLTKHLTSMCLEFSPGPFPGWPCPVFDSALPLGLCVWPQDGHRCECRRITSNLSLGPLFPTQLLRPKFWCFVLMSWYSFFKF